MILLLFPCYSLIQKKGDFREAQIQNSLLAKLVHRKLACPQRNLPTRDGNVDNDGFKACIGVRIHDGTLCMGRKDRIITDNSLHSFPCRILIQE